MLFLQIFIIFGTMISLPMKRNICLLVLGALSLLMLSGCYRLRGGHIELSESYVELPSSGGERTVYALGNQFQIISISFTDIGDNGYEGWLHISPTDDDGNGFYESITISAGRNDSGSDRSACIALYNGPDFGSIDVVQPAD